MTKKRTKYNHGTGNKRNTGKLKPSATSNTDHLSAGNDKEVTRNDGTEYRIITKKDRKDVIAGKPSGAKIGGPKKLEVINVQRFIIQNLPEERLKALVDLLYKIAITETNNELVRMKAAETLMHYGLGKPKETLQLAMPTPSITIQHNVINTSREELNKEHSV